MKKYDFPLLKNNPNLVYLDNASSTQKPQIVIDTLKDFYENYNSNVHRGLYEISEKSTNKYEESRNVVAKFLNAKSEEIIFTQGTTDGMNAISQMLFDEIHQGDTIISTYLEHHSSFLPFQRLAKQKKSELKFVNLNDDLSIDMDHFEELVSKSPNLKLVVLTGMSNVTGYISPLKEICKLIHNANALLVVDGAQLIPHKKVDVVDLDVDFLTFSGHKIYGPTGIGVLYAKKEYLERLEPFRVGGGMITQVDLYESQWKTSPEKFEAGTPHIEGAIGLAAAINYVESIGLEAIEKHEKELFDYTIQEFSKINYIEIYSKNISNSTGVVSFNIKGVHAHDTADILGQSNIAVRAGHHCCQILMKKILKVDSTTRMSFSIYNTKEDIDKLIIALEKVVVMLG